MHFSVFLLLIPILVSLVISYLFLHMNPSLISSLIYLIQSVSSLCVSYSSCLGDLFNLFWWFFIFLGSSPYTLVCYLKTNQLFQSLKALCHFFFIASPFSNLFMSCDSALIISVFASFGFVINVFDLYFAVELFCSYCFFFHSF